MNKPLSEVHRRDAQTLIVSCPYCGAEGVVDLRPYQGRIETVLRGEDPAGQVGEGQRLPEIFPTRKRE